MFLRRKLVDGSRVIAGSSILERINYMEIYDLFSRILGEKFSFVEGSGIGSWGSAVIELICVGCVFTRQSWSWITCICKGEGWQGCVGNILVETVQDLNAIFSVKVWVSFSMWFERLWHCSSYKLRTELRTSVSSFPCWSKVSTVFRIILCYTYIRLQNISWFTLVSVIISVSDTGGVVYLLNIKNISQLVISTSAAVCSFG